MLGFGNISKGWNWLKFEDSNVGYTQKDSCANYSLAIPMFRNVGAEGLALQDIVPVGENVTGSGDITLQTFTDMAAGDEIFMWLTDAEMGLGADGWYTEDYSLAEKTFKSGEGFMLGATSGAIQLNFAGEVNLDEVVVDCRANYSLLGNLRPVPMNIQSIVPSGENVTGSGDITLQTFTDMAAGDEIFMWLTDAEMGLGEDGWYTEDYSLAEKTFVPGEGFMLGATSGAITLTFAKVEL